MALSIDFVTRSEWDARSPDFTIAVDEMPTPQLWLHHSAGSGTDETAMRAIQNFHMDVRGWSDIAYSYLLDNDSPDIDIFTGRGAGISGAHTACCNHFSHAICVIGNYTTTAPNDDTLARIAYLVAYGHQEGWWPLGFTGGHRDSPDAATTCPGDALWKLIPDINAEAIRIYNDSLEDDLPYTEAELIAFAEDGARKALNAKMAINDNGTSPLSRNYMTHGGSIKGQLGTNFQQSFIALCEKVETILEKVDALEASMASAELVTATLEVAESPGCCRQTP